jgi:hypothetical protein
MHHDAALHEGARRKPLIIMDYNKTKTRVDVIDQMMKQYTAKGYKKMAISYFLQVH